MASSTKWRKEKREEKSERGERMADDEEKRMSGAKKATLGQLFPLDDLLLQSNSIHLTNFE